MIKFRITYNIKLTIYAKISATWVIKTMANINKENNFKLTYKQQNVEYEYFIMSEK